MSLLPLECMQDIFLGERVIFQDVFLKLEHIILQGAHLQFVAHHMDNITPCHDTQFRVQCFDYLHIHIVDPIQHHWVDIFKNYMLLYHPIRLFLLQIYITYLSFPL